MKFNPPTSELYADYLALEAKANLPTPEDFNSQFVDWYIAACKEVFQGIPSYDLLVGLMKVVDTVYRTEFSRIPLTYNSELEEARLRALIHDRMEKMKNPKAIEYLITKITTALFAFSMELPRIVFQTHKSDFYVSLGSLLPNPKHAAEVITTGFLDSTYFHSLRSTILSNSQACERHFDLKIYLQNTPFLDLFNHPLPFSIATQRFGSHGIIIAPPEHGKTQLLTSFIKRFLDDGETGLVVLDPHGDLFASLKDKIPPERRIILDPSTNPPPLNVFDFKGAHQVQILQAFTYLMAALTGGMSEKQLGILPYLLKLIQQIQGANVATLLKLVTERPKTPEQSEFFQYVQKLQQLDRDFFINQFLGNKMTETKDAIAWKLSSALSYDAFREMFTASHNSFDAFKALQEQKVVLVKGSERVLGEQGLSVFLQFIVAQFFLAALKRDEVPEKDRKLCVVLADEASHVFNSQTTRILTECRKYRLGFLAATQVIQQIPQDVKAAIYGATAIKIAGAVSHTDAMLLAREMHTTPEDIRALKSFPGSHAEWMIYVSNVTDKAMKLSVPFGAMNDAPTYDYPPTIRETQIVEPPPEAPPVPPAKKPLKFNTPE